LIHEKDLAPSGEKAKQLIKAGQILVDGEIVTKPGQKVTEDSEVIVQGESFRYVSRGGLKLQKSLEYFKIELPGLICMDIGASTGGFTDCMLSHGAIKVYAIDVGTNQLDEKLLSDKRVVNLEKVNARAMTYDLIGERIDFVSIDVSFISLSKILPALTIFIQDQTQIVALIKPQFEAGRKRIGKKGVVRDEKTHIDVIKEVMIGFQDNGWTMTGLTFSPITGPKGNIEFLAFCRRTVISKDAVNSTTIVNVVKTAHDHFKKGACHEV
jgi:23S rRNA (cytidine1920-2'-O)/16S rRNA (cytidine1409-2'-O)-methyltransferase